MKKKTNVFALIGTLMFIMAFVSYLLIAATYTTPLIIFGAIFFGVGVIQEIEK